MNWYKHQHLALVRTAYRDLGHFIVQNGLGTALETYHCLWAMNKYNLSQNLHEI